jgi:hypothetical protein
MAARLCLYKTTGIGKFISAGSVSCLLICPVLPLNLAYVLIIFFLPFSINMTPDIQSFKSISVFDGLGCPKECRAMYNNL